MYTIVNGKNYRVDDQCFLIDPNQWDEDFARNMAANLQITGGLSEKHWEVIRSIRESFLRNGKRPLVYETCEQLGLSLGDLRRLFPTGYLRGACLIAGVAPSDRWGGDAGDEEEGGSPEEIYHVDVDGFLVDADQWDGEYARRKAAEMKVPGGLGEKHWQIIYFLRDKYQATGKVPTVYECCEDNDIELDDLASLFPDGYQRGAVKIAGLRTRKMFPV